MDVCTYGCMYVYMYECVQGGLLQLLFGVRSIFSVSLSHASFRDYFHVIILVHVSHC